LEAGLFSRAALTTGVYLRAIGGRRRRRGRSSSRSRAFGQAVSRAAVFFGGSAPTINAATGRGSILLEACLLARPTFATGVTLRSILSPGHCDAAGCERCSYKQILPHILTEFDVDDIGWEVAVRGISVIAHLRKIRFLFAFRVGPKCLLCDRKYRILVVAGAASLPPSFLNMRQ
jgi:hypothetical protein